MHSSRNQVEKNFNQFYIKKRVALITFEMHVIHSVFTLLCVFPSKGVFVFNMHVLS